MTHAPTISLSPRAACLRALLERSPRSWGELAAAGLDARAVQRAAEELRARGEGVHLGGERVALISPAGEGGHK